MKLKYILTTIILFLFMIPNAKAAYCDENDMKRINEIVEKITIKAQYAKEENGKDNGYYDLVISGLIENLYIKEEMTNQNFTFSNENNGIITLKNLESGKYRFKVYYEICADELIKTINYKLPKYNLYALDPLCEGISKEKLKVCDRAYQEEITRDEFIKEINKYKSTLGNEQQTEDKEDVLSKIIRFMLDYYIYIIASIILIVVITIVIIINKKRGALE